MPRRIIRPKEASLDFSGASDRVDLGTDFIGTGDVTFMAFLKLRSMGGSSTGRVIDNGRFIIDTRATDRIGVRSDALTTAQSAASSVPLNRWFCLTVTRTAAGVANIKIDDVLSGGADLASGTPVAATTNLTLGNQATLSRQLDGGLWSPIILNRIATAAEQTAYCKKFRPPDDYQASVLAEYQFNELKGTATADQSGNGRNGTVSGATWSADAPFRKRKRNIPFTTSVRLNGSSSFFVKTSPTGINTGTGSRSVLGRIYLTGATDNALGCFAQFKRSLVNQSPGFLIGVLGGVYYVGFDTINPTNNLTITEAEFKRHFKMRRWLDVAYVMTTTTLSVYVNRVLVATKTWGVPINTLDLTAIYFGKATVAADSDAYFGAWLMKDFLVVNGACTPEEISDWSLKGIRPAGTVDGYRIEEGTGQDTADDVGSNNLTGSNITWTSSLPTKARSTASGRENANITASVLASATGSISINDNNLLGGRDSTGVFTVTDWTAMAGGNFDILGMVTLTEGVEFVAETSNEVTAQNIADALDIVAGEDLANAVGATVTVMVGGEDEGGEIVWSGTGVSPTTAVCSGGLDKIKVIVNGAGFTFPDDVAIGVDADASASNLATALNAYGGVGCTALAVGNVVNLTADAPGSAGNAVTLVVEGSGGGPIEDDVTISGPTLTGGADAATARSRSLVT